MPIHRVWKISGVGDVIAGRVAQGTIAVGANVRFHPTGCRGTVSSIEKHHISANEAVCGDMVGIHVKKLPRENMPLRGDVMAIDDVKVDPNPPEAVAEFTALVFVQDHPAKLCCGRPQRDRRTGEMVIKGGFRPTVHIRTGRAPCQMIGINWKMGRSTSNMKVEGVPYIEAGDQAEVVFKPKLPLVALPFDECKPFGRIAVMNSNSLVMLGKVIKVVLASDAAYSRAAYSQPTHVFRPTQPSKAVSSFGRAVSTTVARNRSMPALDEAEIQRMQEQIMLSSTAKFDVRARMTINKGFALPMTKLSVSGTIRADDDEKGSQTQRSVLFVIDRSGSMVC